MTQCQIFNYAMRDTIHNFDNIYSKNIHSPKKSIDSLDDPRK